MRRVFYEKKVDGPKNGPPIHNFGHFNGAKLVQILKKLPKFTQALLNGMNSTILIYDTRRTNILRTKKITHTTKVVFLLAANHYSTYFH
jgi:hypothetical protein